MAAHRDRVGFDIPVIQDLALRATDPTSGLALDCSSLPVMGWAEAGPDYPRTLAWAAAYTGNGPAGWLAMPAVPPDALPSPGRMRLVDRPGQRPLALRWHLGGWGDESQVQVFGLGP